MLSMKKVAIVIPTWNNKELLRNCMNSLQKTSYPWYKAVVVDNGSSDGSPELVRREFPDVELVTLERNEGFTRGVNSGVRFALQTLDPDYLLILNDDTVIVDTSWLSHMVSVAEKNSRIGIVNCRFISPDGRPQPMGLRLLPGVYVESLFGRRLLGRNQEQDDSVHETDSAGGACFLLKRSLIEAIGLLDEHYSPAYFEDVDYGLRARKAGFKLVHDGKVSMIHIGSATGKKLPSGYMAYVYRRNLVRFVRKNYPATLPFFVLLLVTNSFVRAAMTNARMNKRNGEGMGRNDDVRNTIRAIRALRSGD